jgi:transcriptional regulator with XRE-family HTH domain
MNGVADLLGRVREQRELPPPAVRRAVREAAGVSRAAVGQALGVSRLAIAQWEAGSRYPRPAHLRAYAELLRALMRGQA